MTEPWLGLRSKRGTSEKHVRRLHFHMCKLECERVGVFEVVYKYTACQQFQNTQKRFAGM